MPLNSYIEKIDRYLARDEHMPLVVDVQNASDLSELVLHYNVGRNLLVRASAYSAPDSFPRLESLLNDLTTKENVSIVTEVSSFLKLEGERELQRFLRQFLNTSIAGHAVLITYQCRRFLSLNDPRLSRRIIIVEGDVQRVPSIVFAASDLLPPRGCVVAKGLESLASIVEASSADTAYILTGKRTEAFPHALYSLSSLRDAYDALVLRDTMVSALPKSAGTESQWSYALGLLSDHESWVDVIDDLFGDHRQLDNVLAGYEHFSAEKQWLYFIALKLYGARNNWCLNVAAKCACDMATFVRQIYRCILDKDVGDSDFWACYDSRKDVLRQMGDSGAELAAYCKIVLSKGRNAICYLTDNTQKEQETLFAVLDQYGLEIERERLSTLLEKVCPALHDYLQPYFFGNELLDRYFQDYKYQKVVNKILPSFEALVEEQAQKREYNSILPPRAAVLERLNRQDSQLYFMDAMGVEYLGFILASCRALGLTANVSVCAAELPTITSRNKEFVAAFENSARPTAFIRELDDIKHHGKYDYDFYKNSKLPIHLIRELEVIRNVLQKIKADLDDGKIRRAFMIADHGASRLAVLHGTENRWKMSEKGLHSGRCCPKSDIDAQPDFAADAGDFWAMANYDCFKGGRKANTEVHGGATLEEVCVPVIELVARNVLPEILLTAMDKDAPNPGEIPEIKVSFRKKAVLKVFSTAAVQNMRIVVNGTSYAATELGNNFYQVDMPDLKKPGNYDADVYSENEQIAEGLRFAVQKEGQRENDLL